MEINLVCGTNFHLIENFLSEIKNNNEFEFERIDSQIVLTPGTDLSLSI